MFKSTCTTLYRKYRNFRIQKIALFGLCLCWCILILCYSNVQLSSSLLQFLRKSSESAYLVKSSKCQIKNIDPFSKDIIKYYHPEEYELCTNQPILTYITNTDNIITLRVDQNAVPSYYTLSVVCCYSNITRRNSILEPDNDITMTECSMFRDSVILHHDTIYVRCFSYEREVIYENIHSTYMINDEVKSRITKSHPEKQISVLLIGIDSMSRLNFIRTLPQTYNYVDKKGWISLNGYNKIDDNTLPNLMAILTGYNSSNLPEVCNPSGIDTFDDCPILWSDYKDLGYVTSYAEDETWMSTFNYQKQGFSVPPTDFYFRPYILASETFVNTKQKQGMTYCTGPETAGERIMNLAKTFAVTFKNHPHFGLFWMNSFSHNQLNSASAMDTKIKKILVALEEEDVFENSVVIFFSDHGLRFGNARLTKTGWFEERLPFIYISFPTWFKKTFKRKYNNFINNAYKLTSPYDLYMTLQDFLVLSGHDYKVNQTPSCPTCKSLLDEIEVERSCEEAGIEQHWCTCSKYEDITLDIETRNRVFKFLAEKIHRTLKSYEDGWLCARYSIKHIINTSITQVVPNNNINYLLIKFKTVPEAIFEATISYQGDISNSSFTLSGKISRLDPYFANSNCVKDSNLKKYCSCVQMAGK